MASPKTTPFSAVLPPRFLPLSRLQIHITLETIYEEETNSGELIETSDASSASFLPKNQPCCFLEVPKPWTSCSHNCQCTN
ncbi:hypothetical protein RHGRI_036796 [Rhododendron griersonianum]|uniref:Uncharacterized protein n=1 Tax=Rhododendron griersonianum TaxID=479676 RepID=A0AAV6HPT8_9ERIC|nr:hypothetical protein RHGRI_036796 [Rhododendron griersonianum]